MSFEKVFVPLTRAQKRTKQIWRDVGAFAVAEIN